MGSPCVIHGFHSSPSHLESSLKLAQAEVLRLEKKYSRYREDSVLTQLNSTNKTTEVDGETAGLLNYAQTCFQFSDGLFDITSGVFRTIWNFREARIPSQASIDAVKQRVGFEQLGWDGERLTIPQGMEIDLGGVVKEYAADQARNILIAHDIQYGLVDLGGDMSVVGPKPDGQPWLVGVRNPENLEKPVVTIPLSAGAIATSGYYERYVMIDGQRYCHIINPKTGWPVKQVATVSVVSDQCLVSGSLTTVAMLKELHGAQWLEEQGATFFLQLESGQQFGSIQSRHV